MNRYRWCTFIFICVLLNCALSFASGQRVVRVGAFSYYPAIFKDADGDVKGFYVDALADIGRRENIRFEYVYGSWSEGLERIKSGEVDVLTSVAFTPERAVFMDYARTPLLTVWGELYVPLTSDIDGIREVQGKKIAVMKGDFNARHFIELVKKFDISCEFVEMPGFDDVFKAVAAGKVDAGVVNSTFGVARQNDFGLRSTGVVFNPFDIFITVAKGKNQDLLALLDGYLANWRHEADSPYNKARQKWSHGNNVPSAIPRWLINAIVVLGVLVLCAVMFIALLKRQVRRATDEIRQREMQLRESEFNYQILSDSGQALIWTATPDKRCNYFNKVWLEFTGRTFDQEVGNGWAEGVHPDDLQRCLDTYVAAFDKREPFSMDYRLRRYDGEYRWLQDDGCPHYNLSGEFVGYIGYCLDITWRKLAEKQLQIVSSRHEAVLAAVSDIIMEVDMHKVYTWANRAGLAFFGDDVIGKEAAYYFAGEQQTYEVVEPLFSGDERLMYVENWQKRVDGEIRLLAWWCKVLVDENGTAIGVLSSARDITENKRIQDALEHQVVTLTRPLDDPTDIQFVDLFNTDEIQHIQDTFAEAVGVASIITTPDGTPITRPSNFCRLCRDIIRKSEKGLANCLHSDAVLGKLNPGGPVIQPCLSGGLWDAGSSITVGGKHIANWLIGQVRNEELDENGMLGYADEIGVDRELFRGALAEVPVMQKEQFEKVSLALHSFARELSRKAYQNIQQGRFIAERSRIERELQDKNTELERFTYTVSHDLKSPLITIQSYTGMIAKDLEAGNSPRAKSDLARIEGAAAKMTALLNDLLELSRIGRQMNDPQQVDMNRLVEETLEQLAGLLESKKIEVVVSPGLPGVFADRKRIAEVVQNLVENAVKYMGDQPAPRIEVGVREGTNRECIFTVSDNGMGINARYHETVFGLFNKLNVKSEGTGIGLALVRRIVELHGGRVWVESEGLGQGSTFCFTLPANVLTQGVSVC